VRAAAATLLLSLVVVASATAAVSRNPRAEKLRITAAGTNLAESVDLQDHDLAGAWETSAPVPYGDGSTGCAGYRPDFSRFTIVGRAHSAYSQGAARRIDSGVEVYPSAAQARGDYRVGNAKPAVVARCFGAQLVRGLRQSGAAYTGLRTRYAALRVGDRGIQYSVSVRITSGGQSVPLWFDVLGFQKGRVQAALMFTSVGSHQRGQLALARALAARSR
jgi:hypothetical protein